MARPLIVHNGPILNESFLTTWNPGEPQHGPEIRSEPMGFSATSQLHPAPSHDSRTCDKVNGLPAGQTGRYFCHQIR